MSSSGVSIRLGLGTAPWTNEPSDASKPREFLDIARKHGISVLDTARLYGNGASEVFLGHINAASEFEIITKSTTGVVPGGGSKSAIMESAETSLKTLNSSKVSIYLLHGPDDTVPISETLDAVQELYLAGKFDKFGLSNFNLNQVLEVYNYNVSKGYVLPSVYQSIYNLMARSNEDELFPTLHRLGFAIQVYSPIASGFLVKSPEEIEQGKGKWNPSSLWGKLHQALYGKPALLQFLRDYIELAQESGNSQSALAYRWVRYNSALAKSFGGTLLIGASSPKQLEETLTDLEKGPLEPSIAARLDEMWQGIASDAPADNITTLKQVMAAETS